MYVLSIDLVNSFFNYSLYKLDSEELVASGFIENNLSESQFLIKYKDEKIVLELEINDYKEVVNIFLNKLLDLKVINSLYEIKEIGFKVSKVDSKYDNSCLVTDKLIDDLINLSQVDIALIIKSFKEIVPECLLVCVFDTQFYNTIPKENYIYPVPYKWFSDYDVRKYGFNGIIHNFVTLEMRKVVGKDDFKFISCYLDRECSITAVKNMQSVDTSQGFSNISGAMMSNHSGDIDFSIIPYIMEKEGKNASEVIDDLSKSSGLLGLSGYSDDIYEILKKCEDGDEFAILAKNKYVRRIVDYIAQYYVLLDGVDYIVFTGSIGENCSFIRREICEKLLSLGVKIDLEENCKSNELVKISSDDSKISVYVVPSSLHLMIMRECKKLLNR